MRSFPQILDGCIEKEKVWMSGSVLKNATFVTPVKSAQFEEMAEATPHASKAAAVLQIEAAELTALSVNPKTALRPFPSSAQFACALAENRVIQRSAVHSVPPRALKPRGRTV